MRPRAGYVGFTRTPTTGAASGVWTLREAETFKRAGTWPAAPSFANVSLLLHMDGTNESTTFTDSSSNGLSGTASGNAQISTSQSKFGGASGYFDGDNSTRVFFADNDPSDFEFDGDFTVEAWVYPISAGNGRTIVTRHSWPDSSAWYLRLRGDAWLTSLIEIEWHSGPDTGAYYTFPATIAFNEWQHVAVCRGGDSIRAFLNGTQVGDTQSNSGVMTGGTWGCGVGGSAEYYSWPFDGYIDELRITKGVAHYTANFTPPTAPFPDA